MLDSTSIMQCLISNSPAFPKKESPDSGQRITRPPDSGHLWKKLFPSFYGAPVMQLWKFRPFAP